MPRPPATPSHLLRIGVAATALILGATLVFTAWAQWRGLAAEAHRLEQDPGEDLLRGIERDRSVVTLAPSRDAGFAALLAHWEHAGLRYVALVAPDGTVLSAAGHPTHATGAPLPPGATWTVEDGRVWMVEGPHAAPPSTAAGGGPRDPALARARDAAPRLVIEYVPDRALALQRMARRGLLLALWVAGTLLAGAVVVWRLSVRAEAAAAREAAQQQLAALGRMSAVLAHELRNPLTSLKGHAQLLEEFLPPGRSQAKAERVVAEAVRMETLITDLLEFVRAGRIQREAVDLDAVVHRAAAAAAAAVPVETAAPVAVEGTAARPGAPLLGDAERLHQVVVNLVENGLQHGPPVTVRLTADRRGATVTVDDQGPGVAADQREQIFAPFHTTRTRGTGLGLAVARQIAVAHGGQLDCGPAPEGGARFTLRLPRGGPPAP